MKIKLIPEIKQAWKYASVWLSTIVATLAGLQSYVPEFAAWMPPHWLPYAVAAIGVARVIQFGKAVYGSQNVNPS